ncbi:MAG: NAD(P)/FAD-dependent oxidoreductase [Desulfovibrio sp.]|nr:MAG: NAD(P)/FAD-dependent oxidoreductase [Desulfovibrio sp.]
MAKPTHSTNVRLAGRLGEFTGQELQDIAQAVREHGVSSVFLTTGQRIMLTHLSEVQAEALREQLAPLVVTRHDMAHGCVGAPNCKFGQAETQPMALALQELAKEFKDADKLRSKIKIGVSGCPHCCAESRVRDIGLIAKGSGWTVCFGGNAGAKPRIADEVASGLSHDEALSMVRELLEDYCEHAKPKERTARFVERVAREIPDV